MTADIDQVDVSVVIPVLNAAETIGAQLDALGRQDFDGTWEVIVALQACTDETPQVLSRRTESNLRVADASAQLGAGFARNLGVEAARSELVAFCDADDVVTDDWLSQLVARRLLAPVLAGSWIPFEGMTHPGDPGEGARELPVFGCDAVPSSYYKEGMSNRVRLMPFAECGFLPTAYSCNMLVDRAAFLSVGGFDHHFHRRHDVELSWRLQVAGHAVGLVPEAVVYKRERSSTRGGWVQAFRWARYEPALYRRYAPHGMRRSVSTEALRDWWWVASRAPLAGGSRKQIWLERSATRAGRLIGTLTERCLYL